MQEARVKTVARAKRAIIWVPLFVGLMSSIASAPDPGDLWKLRIGLLKLEVVDKENLMKLSDRADEVVSALECKYLNVHCPKDEKQPPKAP